MDTPTLITMGGPIYKCKYDNGANILKCLRQKPEASLC
jgi:hypothetical protein